MAVVSATTISLIWNDVILRPRFSIGRRYVLDPPALLCLPIAGTIINAIGSIAVIGAAVFALSDQSVPYLVILFHARTNVYIYIYCVIFDCFTISCLDFFFFFGWIKIIYVLLFFRFESVVGRRRRKILNEIANYITYLKMRDNRYLNFGENLDSWKSD